MGLSVEKRRHQMPGTQRAGERGVCLWGAQRRGATPLGRHCQRGSLGAAPSPVRHEAANDAHEQSSSPPWEGGQSARWGRGAPLGAAAVAVRVGGCVHPSRAQGWSLGASCVAGLRVPCVHGPFWKDGPSTAS